MNLTNNQQRVFDLVESSNENIMILGKPGVGKSVLINKLVEDGRKTYSLAAPTGLAATNIGGRTLHSLFGLPVSAGIIDPTYNEFTNDDKKIANIKYQIKHLIIDEISMVRADTFDFIDRLLREVKGVNVPFGGVQIIAVGDFYQLPPVVVGPEQKQLTEAGYESPFVFSSAAYRLGNFKPVLLHEVLRQKGDPDFIKLLDDAREGNVKPSSLAKLNANVKPVDDLRIRLTAVNKQADAINAGELAKLPEPSYTFFSKKFGEWPKGEPIEDELRLKVGAQVMVKMNGADRPPKHQGEFNSQVVNGTLGKVHSVNNGYYTDEEGEDITYQYVTIENEKGALINIYPKRWEKKVKKKVEGTNRWEEVVVASCTQIPLALAWAISMHKSQGQSFDKVHIDGSKIFAHGQGYVALSRCRSLAGISLASPLDARKITTDPNVKRFFNSIEEVIV